MSLCRKGIGKNSLCVVASENLNQVRHPDMPLNIIKENTIALYVGIGI